MMKLNLRSPICVNMLKSIRHLSNLRNVNNIRKIQSINNNKNGSLKKISLINRRFFSSATESNKTEEKEEKDQEEEQLEEKDEKKADKESKTEEDLKKENESMVQKLATLEMKLKELELKYKMCLSNCDNMCKIHKKEVENTKVYAVTEFARGLLEVADTFELAFKHLNESESESEPQSEKSRDFVDGIKMTESMLQQTFEKFGIKKYESLNEEFNPQVHEAMFEVKDHETHNKVIQVVKNGYTISGRILRPAKVGVSRK